MYISPRRLGVYAAALVFADVMNFTIPRLMPGTPVDAMIAQLGSRATPAAIEAIKARFGAVDMSISGQFIDYVKGLATLDLGVSVKYYPQTVVEVLGRSTLWTACSWSRPSSFRCASARRWAPSPHGGAADASTRLFRRYRW
jgi:peptide/nickel transport system permease protein